MGEEDEKLVDSEDGVANLVIKKKPEFMLKVQFINPNNLYINFSSSSDVEVEERETCFLVMFEI